MVESVATHAEKGVGTKTTLYVGQEEEEEMDALLRMPRRCTQRGLRTVRQRIMPYVPQATIVRSTTGRNRAVAHVPL